MPRKQQTALGDYAQLMLENAPVGMALFDARDFHLLAANPSYESLLAPEWQDGRAVGRGLTEFLPLAENARLTELMRNVVETGTSSRLEEHPAANDREERSYWNWSVVPIVEQGQVTAVLLTVTEVTTQVVARQKVEQARETPPAATNEVLASERQWFSAVLDQLPEGIVLVEARTGKIRYANQTAAQLLGFALANLVDAPLNQSAFLSPYGLLPRHQQAAFRWNFALINALWGKTVTSQEIVVTRPDGSEIVVLSSAAPIHNSGRLITEAVLVFQDITALKQLERQKNEFFAVANHELRTPLTLILGFADMLQMFLPDGADKMYKQAIANIVRECDHLYRLIDECMDVSRLELGCLELKRSYHDLLAPLKQMVSRHIRSTNGHRIFLTLSDLAPQDQLMGWFDLLRIEQIVRNLISNAVKYSPADSEIEVGIRLNRDAQQKPQEAMIWVKDHGIGIAIDDQPHIFERFYRASTLDSSITGFGVGLYLTRQFVQGHGGRIWVESTRGKGSTFFVAFPLRETLQDDAI